MRCRGLDERLGFARLGNIGRLGQDGVARLGQHAVALAPGLTSSLFEATRGGIEPSFIAGADSDATALGQQRLSNGIANTVATSCDGGDPAPKTEVQVSASGRGGFGDGWHSGGRRAPAVRRFLGLRIGEVLVVLVGV